MNQNLKALIIGIDSSIISDLLANLSYLGYEIYGTSRRPRDEGKDYSKILDMDVSSIKSIENAFSIFGLQRFDLIVSAVGITAGTPLENDSPENIEYTVSVNLTSQLWMLPHIVKLLQKNGVAFFLGSSAAEGESFDITYSACKAGLRAAISSYLKTRPLGTKRIYILEPSLVEESTMYGEMSPVNISTHRKKWDGSLLQKSEISKAILSLASDKAQNNPVHKIRPGANK